MFADGEINIAIGKCATQSSDYGGSDPSRAVSGSLSDTFAFSTKLERNPWWAVDLGCITPIDRIVIWNRNDTGVLGAERARPLRVDLSDDGLTWRTLLLADFCFGGRDFGKPLTIEPLNTELARHIRLTVEAETFLHLDQVQVFLRRPTLRFGQLRDLRIHNGILRAKLISLHDSGFFASCTTTLDSLVSCLAHAIQVEGIDCSRLFSVYQDIGVQRDIWQHVFIQDDSVALPPPRALYQPDTVFTAFHNHFHYRDLQFEKLTPLVRRYCGLAEPVRDIQKELMDRNNCQPNQIITLCYRGTDKAQEIRPTDIQQYIAKAEKILKIHPKLRVLIQTDQKQVRDFVANYFGERCLFFPEMPVTTGTDAVHNTDIPSHHGIGRFRFAQTLLAVVELLSHSRYVITHSGNVGLWLSLFRGGVSQLYQFDGEQRLIEPR